MSRPFGVALLVAGHDADEGYQLYHTDPSGTFVSYQAKAIGQAARRADDPAGGVPEGHDPEGGGDAALSTLKAVMEEKVTLLTWTWPACAPRTGSMVRTRSRPSSSDCDRRCCRAPLARRAPSGVVIRSILSYSR